MLPINSNLVQEIEKDLLQDIEIHTISNNVSASIKCGTYSDSQGWLVSSGSKTVIAYTNTSDSYQKYLPISGINEPACTLAPGESLHCTITAYRHGGDEWYPTINASKSFSFYLLY